MHPPALGAVLILALAQPVGSARAEWAKPAAGPSQSGDPEVLFTFDDGPHQRYSGMVLDVLADHGVHGIFFWTGYRIEKPHRRRDDRRALVGRAIREGHIIGTHTVNHIHMCSVPREVAAAEVDRSIAEYEQLADMPMMFFRAPYGSDCPQVRAILAARGISHLHWDIDPHEWLDHDAERVAADITDHLANLDAGGRVVILLHDTYMVTPVALDLVLDWIEEENARRAALGQRPIRVISGSTLAAERMDNTLGGLAVSAGKRAARDLAAAMAAVLPVARPERLSRNL